VTLGRLYRCYDHQGDLLYIGQTTRPIGVREAEHAQAAWWWPAVAYVTYQDVSGDLAAAEACAIRAERPWWNRVQYPRALVTGEDRPQSMIVGAPAPHDRPADAVATRVPAPPSPRQGQAATPSPPASLDPAPAPRVRRHRPPGAGTDGSPGDDRDNREGEP
jgi:hypothetical protein